MAERTKQEKKQTGQKLKKSNIISLIGSIMLIAGLFMPWITKGRWSANPFENTGITTVLIVASGLLAAALCITGLIKMKSFTEPLIFISLSALVLTIILYIKFTGSFSRVGSGSIEIGTWVCLIGGIVMFFGAASTVKISRKAKK